MIDFTSTNASDEQTKRCCHLLAAVLAQAVRDIATPLLSVEREQQRNMDDDAREALTFIFDKQRPEFSYYCKLVGVDPDAFRDALLAGQTEISKHPRFTEDDFRVVRRRVSWQEPCYFVEQGEKARS